MAMKNRYSKSSKLSEARFWAVVKGFAADLTALRTAQLCGVNRNTVNRIYRGLRERIFVACEAQRPFFGVVEVDESFFGARRVKGKLVLSRFSSGLFRAMFAVKEIENGKEIHRRVSA